MGQRQSHRGQALGGGVNNNHRVFFPGIARRLVPHTAPQINYLLAPVIDTTSRTQFVSFGEIPGERLPYRLITAADKAMYFDRMRNLNERVISFLLNQNVSCASRRQTDYRFCQWTYSHFNSFPSDVRVILRMWYSCLRGSTRMPSVISLAG